MLFRSVAAMQFRIEELNPFMEWHLHATEASLEVARESAKRIPSLIGRKTRVVNEAAEVDPLEPLLICR